MSEQIEIDKPERPVVEGRYRYLADFSKQQSPNLRKLYRDSIPRHQLSNKRQSPSHRPSPYNSSNKRSTHFNQYSPTCSTFKPRRELTQEQFSPYDEGPNREEERLNRELREQNTQLRTQLVQANQIGESLRAELTRRETELIQIREASQADLRYFEKVVSEMAGEIQIVLTKNKILQNQLAVAKARLQQQMRRLDDYSRIEQERRKLEQRRRDDHSRDQKKIALQERVYQPPQSRRSVGKLMSRPANVQHEPKQQSLGTSKIKIEEQESENGSQLNFESKKNQNLPQQTVVEKQNKKGQQLIQSIRSMYFKIKGAQSSSLRQLWKWLKGIGHSQSCLKRWKGKAEAGSYLTSERLRQLIKQACSYIQ